MERTKHSHTPGVERPATEAGLFRFYETLQTSFSTSNSMAGRAYARTVAARSKIARLWTADPEGAVSPYALIAYLRHFDCVEAAPDLGGEANKSMYRYEPSLIEIAGIDDRHKLAMHLIETVAGVVTIDANIGLPTSQSVELVLETAAGLENLSATMQFEDFGEPFDPETLQLRGG